MDNIYTEQASVSVALTPLEVDNASVPMTPPKALKVDSASVAMTPPKDEAPPKAEAPEEPKGYKFKPVSKILLKLHKIQADLQFEKERQVRVCLGTQCGWSGEVLSDGLYDRSVRQKRLPSCGLRTLVDGSWSNCTRVSEELSLPFA